MNQDATSYFGNTAQNMSNGLTPFAQSFSYGNNTLSSSAAQAAGWQGAAMSNGAGPNANNLTAPWSFDQFAMGINPFINPGTGQAVQSGTVAIFPLILLALFIGLVIHLMRRI